MTSALYPNTYVFRAFAQGATVPLAGGLLYFYAAGTSTPQAAYTDTTGSTPCANPLVLDANGVASFCLLSGLSYKINLTDANGVTQDGWPKDNILLDDVAAFVALLAGPTGAAQISYLAPYTGAVARTQASKNADFVSVKDEGALGNGSTDDTTAIGKVEALTNAMAWVPDGGYPLADATTTLKEYLGPGSFLYGGTNIAPPRMARFQEAVNNGTTILGDLTAFNLAIKNRAATVVFLGDSISEGVSETSLENAWTTLVANDLRTKLPGVAWNIQNLSLGGYGIENIQDPAFVATASDNPPASFMRVAGQTNYNNYPIQTNNLGVYTMLKGLWPSGSTIGKSWRDHVKDATPDVIFIAMGQNDVSMPASTWSYNAQTFINYTKTWPKPPSIVLVTACPPTRKQATYRGYQDGVQTSADAARAVALNFGYTLIDANRHYLMLRDGVDYVNPLWRAENGYNSYPTNWIGTSPQPTLAGYLLTYAGAGSLGGYMYDQDSTKQSKDIHISATFTPTAGGTAFGLLYRMNNGTPSTNYEAQVNGATIALYWSGTLITSVGIVALTGGTSHTLDVIAVGGHHQVYLDGVLKIDVWDYNFLGMGNWGVQLNGAGTINHLSVLRGVTNQIAPAGIFSEDQLLGISPTEYNVNAATNGGDGIHHPSFSGHYNIYYAASLGFIEAAARIYNGAKKPVSGTASVTAGALASTDFVLVAINGNVGSVVMVSGSAGLLGASAAHAVVVTVAAAGGTIGTYLVQNGVTTLVTVTLTFPAPGVYLIQSTGSATHNGVTIRHSLTSIAIPIS